MAEKGSYREERSMLGRTFWSGSVVCAAVLCVFLVSVAIASVTTTGNVDPADPTTWDSSTDAYVGNSANGTLTVDNGDDIEAHIVNIGYGAGVTGEATITGAGSTWANSSKLFVGNEGNGALNITNGGDVTVTKDTWVATDSGSSGAIHFDGGTLTTGGLLCGLASLTGTGTINTNGLVSDVDLVFDATHGLNQAMHLNSSPDREITVNLNADGSASMGAGYCGSGTLYISDGVDVTSTHGYIGYKDGSAGTVTVDGAGSTWTNRWTLSVGYSGHGTLNITNGGTADNLIGTIGNVSGSKGTATVDGAGSKWTNSGSLYVGGQDNGTLNITGGGLVRVGGTLTIDYDGGDDSFIDITTGGMLTLKGDVDGSLAQFLDLVEGTDAIRYWDDGLSDWDLLTNATYGDDYTLVYLTEGDLSGYTLLTVGVVPNLFAADFDSDGDVDGDDYVVWQSGFSMNANGDADSDDDTDGNDFLIWQSEFRNGTGNGFHFCPAAAPEPASIALLATLSAGLAAIRRGRLTRKRGR